MHLDAGTVNTPEGWRDVKGAVFACPKRAAPTTAENYEQRDGPTPSVRSVIAAIDEAPSFGGRGVAEAERLGVQAEGLSVWGDGAAWIWNLVGEYFAKAVPLLDVYHGGEKLAQAGQAALGQGEAFQRWLAEAGGKLLGDG